MKPLLLYISSLLCGILLYAQADSTSVATVVDTTQVAPPRFVQPSFFFDYGKAVVTAIGDEKRYEGALTFLFFDHYYLVGEYGVAELAPENAIVNGSYHSDGSYYRIGGGYLAPINATSRLGLSVRYARSTFEDRGEIIVVSQSGIQEEYRRTFDRKNLEARWVELVLTSEINLQVNKKNPEAKINQLFSLGFHFRLRFMSAYDRFSPVDVYSVPGYGATLNNPNPALNLYLRFHPF